MSFSSELIAWMDIHYPNHGKPDWLDDKLLDEVIVSYRDNFYMKLRMGLIDKITSCGPIWRYELSYPARITFTAKDSWHLSIGVLDEFIETKQSH